MRCASSLVLLVLLVSTAAADPEDKPKSAILDDAKALAAKGEVLKAAARFGDAIAAAQSAGDLEAEDAAATALDGFFAHLPAEAPTATQTTDSPRYSAVLAATMRKLDANRAGAFVSASVLARNVLQLATESGDMTAIADAVKIATKSTPGAARAVVAKYAEGLKAESEGHFDVAASALQTAAADAAKARWFELAMHASTELCALELNQNAPDKAATAIATTAAQVDDTCGSLLPEAWLAATKRGCPGAAQTLMKPIADLLDLAKKSGHGGTSASGTGGRADPMTRIGNVLPTWPKGKPFVTASRKPTGFEITWATNATERPLIAFPGATAETTDSGVKLGFFGRSVVLLRVDLQAPTLGAFGGFAPSPVRAYYLLAEGETWGVTKDGVVTISR